MEKVKVYSELNNYLADIAVSYIKFHNLHWNVVGRQFKSVHEYLEVIYDGFADALDEVAELIRMNDLQPYASLKKYLEVTQITEIESKEYTIDEVISISKNDIAFLKESAEKIRKDADEDDNYEVVSVLEGHLTNYNKTLWFLKSMEK